LTKSASEIKHQNSKIGTKVIPDMERKCTLLKTPRGFVQEKALISLYGPDKPLLDSGYFNTFVTLEDLFPVGSGGRAKNKFRRYYFVSG
jgi:hypothetical protein